MIMHAYQGERNMLMLMVMVREVVMEEIGGLTWEVLRVHVSSWSQALEPVTELPAEPPCQIK